jgi:hypothetical protein
MSFERRFGGFDGQNPNPIIGMPQILPFLREVCSEASGKSNSQMTPEG